ncbi:MAG: hypothetical protein WC673_02005 [Candidatus Paceibacterota bacterium]|jgi:hypothetical protein
MRKNLLLTFLAILVLAIVMVAVFLIIPRGDEIPMVKSEPIPQLPVDNTQTPIIIGSGNYLERIGTGDNSDVTSLLERTNPLDVFESLWQQTTQSRTDTDSKPGNPIFQNLKQPVVLSVLPDYVRRGDSVTITGENFTPTNNTVTLGDGPISATFTNLISTDGKTITFVYQPPVVKTMTEEEIRALPVDIISQIVTPIKAAGANLKDALIANNTTRDETQVRNILQNNGYSSDAMYHYFHVTVENSQGSGVSDTALLYGLRNTIRTDVANNKLPSLLERFAKYLNDFTGGLIPVAYAQMNQSGGGFTTGIVMICTCDANVLTFQTSYTGGGSGLYVFSPGFKPSAGSGRIAGFWLGGYQIMGGTCKMYAGITCITIMGNTPVNPVGYSM